MINFFKEFEIRLLFRYVGNYYNHECKIELRDVRLEDGGKWRCEVEKYYSGSSRDVRVSQEIEVQVLRKVTPGKFLII